MENSFFHDLYKTAREVRVGDCCAKSLSHLVHGYLSVYSMVRVCPELENEYGTLQEIHGRLRELAGGLAKVVRDESVELNERIGYVSDLMDTYQVYSDMEFLDEALEAAYRLLSPDGRDEMVLPGKTANVCRLLCNCYYFTGEERCAELAKEIVEERDEEGDGWMWLQTITSCENIIGDDFCTPLNQEKQIKERERLENEVVVSMVSEEVMGDVTGDFRSFDILASRVCRLGVCEKCS